MGRPKKLFPVFRMVAANNQTIQGQGISPTKALHKSYISALLIVWLYEYLKH